MTGTTSINLSPDGNHPSICLYKHKSANWRLTFYISFFLFHQSELNTVIHIEGITMTPSMSYIYFNNHQNSMEYSFYEAIIFPFPCVKYDTIIFTQDWIQFLGKRNNNSFHQAGYKKSNQQSSSPNIWLLNNIDKFQIKTRPECPIVAKGKTIWLVWFNVSEINLDTAYIVYYPHGISKCTFII